ncbi:MAG: DNA mismatch repair protein MutS, partial [Sphingobacteriales bacterium]
MKLYPESAPVQLEFDKIRSLLHERCRTEYAREKALDLRIHTNKEIIGRELLQSHEYKQIVQNAIHFPNDYVLNLRRELRLLAIPGSMLGGEELVGLRKLAEMMERIFRWFDSERRTAYPGLAAVIEGTYYEKAIQAMINEVIDDTGMVKDTASRELAQIRMSLYRKRQELRRVFDRIVSKLNKNGYLADIEESFMNGRRVIAVLAEQKRSIGGILHGESDSRRTAFIEPDETVELNNQVYELENDERKEVYRILKQLTRDLSIYAPLLTTYHAVAGEYDFILAKAHLAIALHAEYPILQDKAHINLVNARHPLLLLYNERSGKPTIPMELQLD